MSAEAAAQQIEDPFRNRAHGAVATYNVGCRCDECRGAMNRRARESRERARAGYAPAGLAALREDWMDDAACAGKPMSMFFPSINEFEAHDSTHVYDAARALCAACPVRQECLDYALAHFEQHGLWGGLTPRERRQTRRRRRNGDT